MFKYRYILALSMTIGFLLLCPHEFYAMESDPVCSICQDELFVTYDPALPICDNAHFLHVSCAQSFVEHSSSEELPQCPLCREDFIYPTVVGNDEVNKNVNFASLVNKIQTSVANVESTAGSFAWNLVSGERDKQRIKLFDQTTHLKGTVEALLSEAQRAVQHSCVLAGYYKALALNYTDLARKRNEVIKLREQVEKLNITNNNLIRSKTKLEEKIEQYGQQLSEGNEKLKDYLARREFKISANVLGGLTVLGTVGIEMILGLVKFSTISSSSWVSWLKYIGIISVTGYVVSNILIDSRRVQKFPCKADSWKKNYNMPLTLAMVNGATHLLLSPAILSGAASTSLAYMARVGLNIATPFFMVKFSGIDPKNRMTATRLFKYD